MKYYSQITKQLYSTEEDLKKAENAIKTAEAIKKAAELKKLELEKKKKAEKATRAKEVEEAFKQANAAQSKAYKLLQEFTKDYGYFHMSYTNEDIKNATNGFLDLLNGFLNL